MPHQNNDVSRLSVPILVLLASMGPLLAVGVSYGVQTTRTESIEKSVEELANRQRRFDDLAERTARIETKIDFLVEKEKSK